MIQDIAAASSSEALHKSSMPPADAWPLTDAAHVFASDDDLAEIKRLDDEIEQKSKFLNEWTSDPSETVKKMTGWDFPGATQAEIDERRSQGWSEDRIDNWMYSRHFWLRAAARAPLLTSTEIETGSLRDDIFTHEAASDAIELIIANCKKPLQRELDSLARRQKLLETRGLLVELKSGTAIAYGRRQSLKTPVDTIPTSFWNDQLILEIDRLSDNPNSVFSTEGAILFTDVRIALAKKGQRQRSAAEAKGKSSALAMSRCQTWLIDKMKATPKSRPKKKAKYLSEAQIAFSGLSERSFNKAWAAATKETGSTWNRGGAPSGPRSNGKTPH